MKRSGFRRRTPPDRAPAPPIRLRKGTVSPASAPQRAKAREGCRVHGEACGGHDPAHVIDRSLGGCNDPACVVPLCRFMHELYDRGDFDLLPHLSLQEQAHAVGHVGIIRALTRITGRAWAETDVRRH